ncbi:hypothetical protein [Brevibacillus sp. SYSU BS000544]|uniref:hypothetical protein n=1 Tax=Brevibacillus sp. SYSU BS000544 TaxID=3416443 RepID=UPI003CE53C7F
MNKNNIVVKIKIVVAVIVGVIQIAYAIACGQLVYDLTRLYWDAKILLLFISNIYQIQKETIQMIVEALSQTL